MLCEVISLNYEAFYPAYGPGACFPLSQRGRRSVDRSAQARRHSLQSTAQIGVGLAHDRIDVSGSRTARLAVWFTAPKHLPTR